MSKKSNIHAEHHPPSVWNTMHLDCFKCNARVKRNNKHHYCMRCGHYYCPHCCHPTAEDLDQRTTTDTGRRRPQHTLKLCGCSNLSLLLLVALVLGSTISDILHEIFKDREASVLFGTFNVKVLKDMDQLLEMR